MSPRGELWPKVTKLASTDEVAPRDEVGPWKKTLCLFLQSHIVCRGECLGPGERRIGPRVSGFNPRDTLMIQKLTEGTIHIFKEWAAFLLQLPTQRTTRRDSNLEPRLFRRKLLFSICGNKTKINRFFRGSSCFQNKTKVGTLKSSAVLTVEMQCGFFN
jgi:hypothetical protein